MRQHMKREYSIAMPRTRCDIPKKVIAHLRIMLSSN
jgi:hypothetical protein